MTSGWWDWYGYPAPKDVTNDTKEKLQMDLQSA